MQTVQTEETKDEIEQNLNIINNWVKKIIRLRTIQLKQVCRVSLRTLDKNENIYAVDKVIHQSTVSQHR